MLEKSGENQGILLVRKSENNVYISGVSENGDIFIAQWSMLGLCISPTPFKASVLSVLLFVYRKMTITIQPRTKILVL